MSKRHTPAPSVPSAAPAAWAFVGLDVGRDALDLACADPAQPPRQFPNTAAGHAQLVAFLTPRAVQRLVLEASGGYERAVAEALDRAGLPVARANPRQVRDFAKALGQLAKTDALDARLLARFAALPELPARPLPSESVRRLADLVARREQLVELIRQERQHRVHSACPDSCERMIAALAAERDAVAAQIQDFLDQPEQVELAQREALLRTAPGIGPVIATVLLAQMPELGALTRQQAASLAGLAPFAHDSGQHRGVRLIRGGRARVRTALYLAALNAGRVGGLFHDFYARLREAGKAAKQALIAVARKLLVLLNAMLRDGRPYTPTIPSLKAL